MCSLETGGIPLGSSYNFRHYRKHNNTDKKNPSELWTYPDKMIAMPPLVGIDISLGELNDPLLKNRAIRLGYKNTMKKILMLLYKKIC